MQLAIILKISKLEHKLFEEMGFLVLVLHSRPTKRAQLEIGAAHRLATPS